MSRISIFLALLLQMVTYSKGDMDFTYSASDLYRLIQTDQRISERLEELVDTFSNFSDELKLFRTSNRALIGHNQPNDIIKNPLLSYQLVKRHVKDLQVFDAAFSSFVSKIEEIKNSYDKVRTTFTKPSDNNLDHSMEAIVRLRQTYNLSIHELSRGKLGNAQFNGTLSPKDLASIGMYAKKSGMMTNSRMFLESALSQHSALNGNYKDAWIDDAQAALSSLENAKSTKGDREDFRVLTEMDAIFATDSLENLNRAFEDLCQIYTVKDPPISTLKCYLDKYSSPVRQISPLKIEVHHEDPQVVVIYDFLSDKEVTAIEDATFYNLKRSHTQFYLQGAMHSEPSIIRTTSQTWIYDLNHPIFGYLSKRIESATGYYLSGVNSAEELQVASYRPGGHYSLHTDATQEEVLKEFLSPEDIIQGDRVATFMVYLSDVESGGNTAFPMLNISVQPIKGSAILWGNLYPDGSIARDTLHGACPVVFGVKNIATKWIRANDQMFTRNNCKPDKTFNHFTF